MSRWTNGYSTNGSKPVTWTRVNCFRPPKAHRKVASSRPFWPTWLWTGCKPPSRKRCAKGIKSTSCGMPTTLSRRAPPRKYSNRKSNRALTAFLQPRGLELSEQKTVITPIHEGFNFLGHTLRKFGDKLLSFPAKSNVQTLRDKVRLCVQSALGLSQEALIRKLNPLLQGWANYYRNGASKRTFEKVDYYVSDQLWRWAKRRHPNQSVTWRKQRYFSRDQECWNFSVPIRLA